MLKKNLSKFNIAIIGLGYVGLPLLLEFSKYFKTIGFDINKTRINELKINIDINNEQKINKKKLEITNIDEKISDCNIYIITVPTPLFKNKEPDLSNLINASKMVSKYLKKDDIVIYESTVYPGVTEDVCGQILSRETNLIINKDFYLGYSPERINPGDKKRTLINIKKIISASSNTALKKMKYIYGKIIKAGIFTTPSIKIAEAAKVIENTQRDINIAFMNELQIIFNKSNLNFEDIIKAASTKWNFLNFSPGLVGGHCIGIDPYYLDFYAKKYQYKSKIILPARKLNDVMPSYHFRNFNSKYLNFIKDKKIKTKKILYLGLSFKKNTNDYRNSKHIQFYKLLSTKYKIDAFDPLLKNKIIDKNNVILINNSKLKLSNYSAVIYGANHDIFNKIFKFDDFKNIFLYNVNK